MSETRTGYFEGTGGVKLYYEDTGEGAPIVFVHEFAGDYRSWEPQIRYFSHRFRVITYNARGYPPSDVPTDPELYSQDIAVDDITALLRHLAIDKAHIVGFSMGSFAALFFGLRYPGMARSVVPVCRGTARPRGGRSFTRKISTNSPTRCWTTRPPITRPSVMRSVRRGCNSPKRTRAAGANSRIASRACRESGAR